MAKNLKPNNIVYAVLLINGVIETLHIGRVEAVHEDGTATIAWIYPVHIDTSKVSLCDLYRSPKRAVLAYVRQTKQELMQQAELFKEVR